MQYLVSSIQASGAQFSLALSLYAAENFDFATAKQNADAVSAQLQAARDEINANLAQINALHETNRALEAAIANLQTEATKAQAALNPNAVLSFNYPFTDFADILEDAKLTNAEKVQAMIERKRSEIEARVQEQLALLKLQQDAENLILDSPIQLGSQTGKSTSFAKTMSAQKQKGKGKRK